jgi:hypothetical protein
LGEHWWSSRRVDQHEPLTRDEVQAVFRRHTDKIPYTAQSLYAAACILAEGLGLPRNLVHVEESVWNLGWFRVRVGDRWFGQ